MYIYSFWENGFYKKWSKYVIIFVKKEFKIGKILKVIRRIEKLFGIVNYIEL